MTATLCLTLAAALAVGIATQVSVYRQDRKRAKEDAYWRGYMDGLGGSLPQPEEAK
jgi:hypothetical protein